MSDLPRTAVTRIHDTLANDIAATPGQVRAAVDLLDGGATVPFIARYRKEVTGGLDDNQLRLLETRLLYLRELEERRIAILDSIAEQGKLTDALRADIDAADSKSRLEDLYLPYKPKRRTKGMIAREAGLEPFLQKIERGLPREEQGRRAAAALIDSGHSFDAVFGVSDEIALGALKELTQRGYKVPDEVGVVGFDGVRAGQWSVPPLTTVESDFEVAGSLLVDRLIATIGGEAPSPRRVPVRLVVRGSTRN